MPGRRKPAERRKHRRGPIQAEKAMAKRMGTVSVAMKRLGWAEATGRGVKKARLTSLGATFAAVMARHQLAKLAKLDAKFGIENDAAFNERAFKFLRSNVSRKLFSFAILDLDNLKRLNGVSYERGDAALRMFTEGAAKIAKRMKGFAGRFGGDEIKVLVRGNPQMLLGQLHGLLGEMRKQNFSFSAGITSGEKAQGIADRSGKKKRELLDRLANVGISRAKNGIKGKIIIQ